MGAPDNPLPHPFEATCILILLKIASINTVLTLPCGARSRTNFLS